jgi:pimeloyl-ACP methyl ester carboxylesterase
MEPPRAQYAWNGDVAIAYGVVGEGPIDLVYIQGYVSDVEMMWECRQAAEFFERLAGWARLITIDRRGAGMSDRFSPEDLPPLEDAAKDVLAVLDAVGSKRAALFGHHEGGQLCAMIAATAPDRVRSLTLFSTPISKTAIDLEKRENDQATVGAEVDEWRHVFGTRAFEQEVFEVMAPGHLGDRELFAFLCKLQRHAASPGSSTGFIHLLYETDISGILDAITVPTLVLHRTGDIVNPISWGRRLAASIRGAEIVELDGADWWPFLGDTDALLDELERFVVGSPVGHRESRTLATVLFTDIVDSTERAAEVGDSAWRGLVSQHDTFAEREISKFAGKIVDTAGDGLFAVFDGPARATRCAQALSGGAHDLGLAIRAGVHTGEVEHDGSKVRGLTVHIGARVAALAARDEVLVSQTVKDLVAGSGLMFDDAGEHDLKGVPDRWRLYRVVG